MTKLSELNAETPEMRGVERLIETMRAEDAERRKEYEAEMRREDQAVEILLGETRRIYVCTYTEQQFRNFRRKLFLACERREIPLKDIRRVDCFGDNLRGYARGHARIVLLRLWDFGADHHLKAQVEWLTRSEEALRT